MLMAEIKFTPRIKLGYNFLLCIKHELSGFSKVKGKAVPLQASTGPQGSRRSRLPDF
jgi:hypothetical protein